MNKVLSMPMPIRVFLFTTFYWSFVKFWRLFKKNLHLFHIILSIFFTEVYWNIINEGKQKHLFSACKQHKFSIQTFYSVKWSHWSILWGGLAGQLQYSQSSLSLLPLASFHWWGRLTLQTARVLPHCLQERDTRGVVAKPASPPQLYRYLATESGWGEAAGSYHS